MPQADSAIALPIAITDNLSCIASPHERKGGILTEGVGMEESAFNALADAELLRMEAALEACGAEVDIETKPGGILELEFENGTKIIINRHSAAREIWVAARSGGYHFRPCEGAWIAGRDGAELYATLTKAVSEQSGETISIQPQ
jgi:CyaY protein